LLKVLGDPSPGFELRALEAWADWAKKGTYQAAALLNISSATVARRAGGFEGDGAVVLAIVAALPRVVMAKTIDAYRRDIRVPAKPKPPRKVRNKTTRRRSGPTEAEMLEQAIERRHAEFDREVVDLMNYRAASVGP
jgi:hypothetical protein